MALDRDAILELLFRFRDQIVILILIGLAAYGVYEVWDDYNRSVDEIIQEQLKAGGGRGSTEDTVLMPVEVVKSLKDRPPVITYLKTNNPFGTPEQQMQLRRQLDEAYRRALDAFRAQDFQGTITILEKEVIPRDVHETRITYAIRPSEMIRQAEIAMTRANMGDVVAAANQAFQAGQASLTGGNAAEGLQSLRESLQAYQRVMLVDPQGEQLGEQQFQAIRDRVASLEQQVLRLQRESVSRAIVQARQAFSQARSGNDPVSLVKAMGQLRSAQTFLENTDTDYSIVPQAERDTIRADFQAAAKEVAAQLPSVLESIKTSFAQTSPEQQSPVELSSNLFLLSECMFLAQANQDTELRQQALAFLVETTDAVTQAVQDLHGSLQTAIRDEKFDDFDSQARERMLTVAQLITDGGLPLPSGRRSQLMAAATSLNGLVVPPELAIDYELVEFSKGRRSYHSVSLREKSTGDLVNLNLQMGKKSTKNFILLNVDTDKGVIILSKSPGYQPSTFVIPKE